MELFDLVDEKDNVIGITDRTTAHATKQPHRVAAVYVFNSAGELYVQVHKKSDGRYDHSVGGHVSKDEDYATAAIREAEEELGIKQPLTYITTFYSNEGSYRHMFGLFECIARPDWQFVPNDEVEEIIPMKLAVIEKMMKDSPEKFTSGFVNSMKHYRKIKNLSLL